MFLPSDWWKVAAPEVWLPTASEMANLDFAVTSSGVMPERVLIENAGRAVARALHERYPNGRVLVLVGSGHNGADALVAGRTLHMWGREVEVVQCGSRLPDPNVLAGWEFDILGPDLIADALTRNDVVIDGILGTGLETAPLEVQATIIERVNEAQCLDTTHWSNPTPSFINQLKCMVHLSKIITKGALLRDEFRGAHYKPEFDLNQPHDFDPHEYIDYIENSTVLQ